MPDTDRITLPAVMDSLHPLLAFALDRARAAGMPGDGLNGLELAAEEALVNVMSYAYPDGSGQVTVACAAHNGHFRMDIVDQGLPFDPTAGPPPDLAAGIEDRGIGGLGMFFMKKFMDQVAYRRDGEENVLTLTKALTPS